MIRFQRQLALRSAVLALVAVGSCPQVAQAEKCESVAECEQRCDTGDAPSCHAQAWLLLQGVTRPGPESNKAMGLLDMACDRGFAPSCYALGDGLHWGSLRRVPVSKDWSRAVTYLRRACELNHGVACNDYGLRVVNGQGVEASQSRGVEIWRKACALNSETGCLNLAYRYRIGRGVEKSLPEAVKYGRKGCSLGSGKACLQVGRLLQQGVNGKPDPAGAETAFKRGCALGTVTACDYADAYAEGTPRQVKFSAKGENQLFFEKEFNCRGGQLLACAEAGNRLLSGRGTKQDVARGIELLERACDGDISVGCWWLGQMWFDHGRNRGEVGRGAALLRRACALEDQRGCAALGLALLKGNQHFGAKLPEARRVLRDACQAGQGNACWGLGSMDYRGLAGPKSERKARMNYDAGCRKNDADSCLNASILYEKLEKPRARSTARARARRACELGNAKGCDLAEGAQGSKNE